MSRPEPFLTRTGDRPVRSFAAALPVCGGPALDSPWTPKSATPFEAPRVDDAVLAAARDQAVADGRAEGLAETEALRAKLNGLIAAFETAAASRTDRLAEHVADAAIATVETWLDRAVDRGERFAPAIRGWLGATGDGAGASARVHPDDAAHVRGAIGDARITVVEDPAIPRGDIHIASSTLELTHAWPARLAELRDAIAAALIDGAAP